MIFLKLFLIFSKIGIFNFGGGYAMLSLIQNEVVRNHWMTNAEFTDMVAISQMTPGPIGINAATYVGYTAVVKAGYPEWAGIFGSILATASIVWLPFILMIMISKYLLKHKNDAKVESVFSALRPTIVGLIAAAALLLMNEENFGEARPDNLTFWVSIALCIGAFVASYRFKVSPIRLLLGSALFGLVFYEFV
jgi:chromate transporter